MKSEAACLDGGVICCGIGPERAAKATEQAIADGAAAIISFGTAGGLDPSYGPGTVIVSQTVVAPDGKRMDAPESWCQALAALLPFAISGAIAGQDRAAATAANKRELFESTNAIAVDMESHAIAAQALAAGIPFMAIRAIADGPGQRLPGWLSDCIGRDGTVDQAGIALKALFRPVDWKTVFDLAAGSYKAHGSLRRVAAAAGPGFGFKLGFG